MIKNIIMNLLVIIVVTAVLILGAFEGEFTLWNIVDAGFIVSIIVFFIGLLTFSNATEVLKSTGHALKTMFSPNTSRKYKSFYDEQQEKEQPKVKSKMAGLPTLIAGTIALFIDIILAVIIMNDIL